MLLYLSSTGTNLFPGWLVLLKSCLNYGEGEDLKILFSYSRCANFSIYSLFSSVLVYVFTAGDFNKYDKSLFFIMLNFILGFFFGFGTDLPGESF